jgi:hypothetical protein
VRVALGGWGFVWGLGLLFFEWCIVLSIASGVGGGCLEQTDRKIMIL